MTPAQLADLVRATAAEVLVTRGLDLAALPADAGVRRPRRAADGSYATSVMLRTAPGVGVPARQLAGWLADALAEHDGVATADVAGPGFVNVRLSPDAQGAVVGRILAAGARFGHGDAFAGRALDVVTDLPGFRATALADATANLLAAQGALVTRPPAPAADASPADTSPADANPAASPADASPADANPPDAAQQTGDDETVPDDAVRYWLLRVPATAPVVLDSVLLRRRLPENPAFLVLHAHARLAATARHAAALGVTTGSEFSVLAHPREGDLIRTLAQFPQVVAAAAQRREPHRVARLAELLAADVDRFVHVCRVLPVGDEETTEVHRARVALCAAARQVLSNALGLLGVGAPERL